jgi:hypothetical protein
VTNKIKTPNATLRRIRQQERRESREEFARAVVATAERLGEPQLACDARLVARWEDGEVACPRPIYQRVLSGLLDRPFIELGFSGSALDLPTVSRGFGDLSSENIDFRIDEEGRVWADVNRRTFLLGSAAALLQAPGVARLGDDAERATFLGDDSFAFPTAVQRLWPGARVSRSVPDFGVDWTVLLPEGRAVQGAVAAVQVHSGQISDGRVLVSVGGKRWTQFAAGRGRGLLVAAETTTDVPRFFAVDARVARRFADKGLPLTVPVAYELDDLTYGILWAATGLDEGLQADDQELSVSKSELAPYEGLPTSAVSREAAPELSAVSHMWLGSDFCARHILRHLDDLTEPPRFWTREQSGEEASTWLLFGHKYEYLRRTKERTGDRLVRGFCIPESAVRQSPRHERILLFLTAALMEACGITVKVTTDPAYAEVDGFVLGGTRRAIVANWVRSDGMWRVDTTDRHDTLVEYRDVLGQVGAHSAIEAASPAGRMQALAQYLELDVSWLRSRCRELGRHGTARMAHPRSRLLSTAGLDAACTFVGSLPAAS